MLIVVQGLRELQIDLALMLRSLQGSVGTIYGTVGRFTSVHEQVLASRGWAFAAAPLVVDIIPVTCPGITLANTATRKAPNAFNFLRQILVLEKAGSSQVAEQETA